MIYTNTGITIPATLTDAPAAYKDGVTDTLWHPAITLVFDREAADAEITALLAGASAIYQDDGTYRTAYALDGRRIRYHPTSVTLPYTAKTTEDSPIGLQRQITGQELALAASEQRYTAAMLHAAAQEGGTP